MIVRPSHTYDRTSVPYIRRLDPGGADAAGQGGGGARRWHIFVDPDTVARDFAKVSLPLLGSTRTTR